MDRVGSGQVGSGRIDLHIDFFRYLIDFDWIADYLISDHIDIRLDLSLIKTFKKKSNSNSNVSN
jgi:hypothetical protein